MKEISFGTTHVLKKVSQVIVFEDKRCYKRIPIFKKNQDFM